MSWQDKYHHNLDLGMRDSVAFDKAVEDQMYEDHQQQNLDSMIENHINEQYEQYVQSLLKENNSE